MTEHSDIHGLTDVAERAFHGITDVVQGVHQAVTDTIPTRAAQAQGVIANQIYDQVRATAALALRLTGHTLALGATALDRSDVQIPLALRSALNGAVGDVLHDSNNPLTIKMSLHRHGRQWDGSADDLALLLPEPRRHLLILVHGLGMNERQWQRDGRPDFGHRFEDEGAISCLRLRYNSGLPIAINGQKLSQLLSIVSRRYPGQLDRISLVGHSMGGLVARSACLHASADGHAWQQQLQDVFYLGSPHLGAPLERAGHALTSSLGLTPYTEPFARIGRARSRGIRDLRHGRIYDRPAQKLPEHIREFVIAATLDERPGTILDNVVGDLLVPSASALGQRTSTHAPLHIPEQRRHLLTRMNHFELIWDSRVFDRIRSWL